MTTKESANIITEQVANLLDSLVDSQYRESLEIFKGSTIGKHIRHIYDFYHCVVLSAEQGVLDYSCRNRDERLENDRIFVKLAFANINEAVKQLDESQVIDVIPEFTTDDSQMQAVKSSIGRELMYGFDHAIHHLAIIKMGIQSHFPNCQLNENLGIAPSTIKYQQKHA